MHTATRKGSIERRRKVAFGTDNPAGPAADDIHNTVVIPHREVVKVPLEEIALGCIAIVVEHDDNRRLFVAHQRAELGARHLKCAIPDQNNRKDIRAGERNPDSPRDRRAHACVIGGRKKCVA